MNKIDNINIHSFLSQYNLTNGGVIINFDHSHFSDILFMWSFMYSCTGDLDE